MGGPFLVLQKKGFSGWLHHSCLQGSNVRYCGKKKSSAYNQKLCYYRNIRGRQSDRQKSKSTITNETTVSTETKTKKQKRKITTIPKTCCCFFFFFNSNTDPAPYTGLNSETHSHSCKLNQRMDKSDRTSRMRQP